MARAKSTTSLFNSGTRCSMELAVLSLSDLISDYSDKLSMANSIEQRVPLLNNEVVDLALAIPFSKKIYPRQTKILLRRLTGKFLPPELIRAPKWGFFSPVSKWFRGDLKEFVADWIDFSDTKDYVNQRQAKKIFKTHLSGGYHPHTIWSVVTFNCWYQS